MSASTTEQSVESTPINATPDSTPEQASGEAAQQEAPHVLEIPVKTVDAGAEADSTSQDSASQPIPFLYRHPTQQMIGGVCGGLGDYFGIDPTLVRILWVVLTLGTAGAGLLAYAALWLLLPVGTAQAGQQAPAALELNERNISRAGGLLVLLGGLWLLSNFGILPALWGAFWQVMRLLFWPLLLISAGVLLLNNQQAWRSRFASARLNLRNGFARSRSKVRSAASVDGASIKSSLKSKLRQAKANFPLKRSREDRLLFGVCGGIGRSIGLDTNLVRLIWVAFAIGSVGTGVLVYVLAGWLLPEERPAIEATFNSEPQDVPVIDGTVY